MKKLLFSILTASMFLHASNIDNNITTIFDKVGKLNFPGYKYSKIILNKYDQKLQTYVGITRINSAKQYDFLLYMYYPKANAIQLITPSNFKMITNNSKTNDIYVDDTIKNVVTAYIKIKNIKKMKEYKQQKNTFLKVSNKDNGIITLSEDPNKNTLVIFIDPNCPYCIQKIKETNFKQLLKQVNIVLIPVPLVTLDKNNKVIRNKSLHPNAMALTTNILASVKNNMSTNEKINIVKKYMLEYNNNNFKIIHNKIAQEEALKNYNDYLKTRVILGTPAVIRLNKKESKDFFNKIK